ncbi:WAT1-related protein [Dichanthelium oligosanthes]|uniref:WAT1-related protein n=1 Tax=Dichanthelium oligosanthes TaxID=888268 RepID=A0A1E5W5A7_9POAL|nr:WAT1-related protein [Dichanthelium oligosanthes]
MPFTWLLKLFLCALVGNTLSMSLYNVSLKFTSATVAAAAGSSMPVVTFCLALLLRMEVVKLRSASGIAKLMGVALCLAGVFTIAFYSGPALSPVNHHRAFAAHASGSGRANASSKTTWIQGTFLMILANVAWSLTIVWQAALLKELPNTMLVATALSVFGAVQSFVVAVAAERDFSSVVGGILLVGGLYSVLWGKNKESQAASGRQVNMTDSAQHEQQHKKANKDELEEAASASAGERV